MKNEPSTIKPCRRTDTGSVLPSSECPTCHYVIDAATGFMGDRRPVQGDISICVKCGEILMYGEGMRLELCDLNRMLRLPDVHKRMLERAQVLIRKERVKG